MKSTLRYFSGTGNSYRVAVQCMRCVNMCSRKAIFQKGYGATKDRNRCMDAIFGRKIVRERKQRVR